MNNFVKALAKEANKKLTENGGEALSSSLNGLLDFFALCGALRSRSDDDIIVLFTKAYAEDPLLALKALFYTRNIRGGLGERDTFRTIIKHMADSHSDDMLTNFENIVKFGRFDDFYAFEGTHLEKDAFAFLKKTFEADLAFVKAGEIHKISLVGKWLKSVNSSSEETKRLGRLTAKYFGLSEKEYRKSLKTLRDAIGIVETKMSQNEWTDIKYDTLPSLAALRYRNAFVKHDEEGYKQYLESLTKGEAKVNASTLYPYDLVKKYLDMGWGYSSKLDTLVEEQWKALPNYVTDNKNFLIMADVSGSMYGTPIAVSISLALYFAERSNGLFHNQFMTFSRKPSLIQIPETTNLLEKVKFVHQAEWGMNTDLYAAFKMVLNAAINGKVKQSELPDALVVITDMEIDAGYHGETFTEAMAKEFEDAGYKMPTLVWWNVDARQNTFHAEYNDGRVRFISGCSAAVFKGLCEKMGSTPLELMLGVLNDTMYDSVVLSTK